MKFTNAPLAVFVLIATLAAGFVSAPSEAGLRMIEGDLHRAGGGYGLHQGHKTQPLASIRVQKKGISKNQAAALVKRRYGGKILAVGEVNRGGRAMYRVKGLSDKSQVYVVYVDKQSGRISR